MSNRTYYCFCEDNCKFETMTKEQILAAIAQAAQGGLEFDTDAAFITRVQESNAGKYLTFWVGTQAQYNAIATRVENCLYIITDNTAPQQLADTLLAAEKAAADAALALNVVSLAGTEYVTVNATLGAYETTIKSVTLCGGAFKKPLVSIYRGADAESHECIVSAGEPRQYEENGEWSVDIMFTSTSDSTQYTQAVVGFLKLP